jgi:hypothetical protein
MRKKNDLAAAVDEVVGLTVDRLQKTAENQTAENQPTAMKRRPTSSALTSTTATISRRSVHRVKILVDDGQQGRRRKLLKKSQTNDVRNDLAVAKSVQIQIQMRNLNHLVVEVVEVVAVAKSLRSSRIFPAGKTPSRRWRLSLLGPITPNAAAHAAEGRAVDILDFELMS